MVFAESEDVRSVVQLLLMMRIFCSSCGAKCEKPEPEVYEGEVVDSEEEADEGTVESEEEDASVEEEAFEDEEKTEE